MASLVYFFKYYLGNEAGVSMFMFWGTAGNIAGVVATGWMTKYLGKRNLYIVAMIVNAITTAAYFMAGPTDMVFLYAMNIIGGFASGPVSPLIWALYADTADYSEWKTGRRATGLVFSAGTFAQKMGWTVGGSLAGYLLAFYGFQANVTQTAGSLLGIRLLVSVIPAVASILAVVAICFYAINENLQQQISTDLAERRAKAGAAPAGA
jgi:GPH family glycoside/pentoside/hexuronide:cation symporter